MADVAITAVQITPAGVLPASPASVGTSDLGIVAKNDGSIVLAVTNASGSQRAVTFLHRTPVSDAVNPAWDASKTGSARVVANSTTKWFGPFPVSTFGKTIQIDTDGTVTVAAFRVDPAGTANVPGWQTV